MTGLVGIGCTQRASAKCRGSSNGDHAVGKWNACTEDDFIAAEREKINQHAKMLVKMGHMSSSAANQADASTILGRYAWHGNGEGYFGAYSFYQPAFEQAKRGWFLNGEVLEGSNELWPQDDWDNATQSHEIKFDQSAIGLKVSGMWMSWYENGEYKGEYFTAKIVGIKNDGSTAILDKRAPHYARQSGMQIVPADWQDLCACTTNFSPRFVDGHPVMEDAK